MNDLQFVGRYQCLPIRCSGRLISLQNEHPIVFRFCNATKSVTLLKYNKTYLIHLKCSSNICRCHKLCTFVVAAAYSGLIWAIIRQHLLWGDHFTVHLVVVPLGTSLLLLLVFSTGCFHPIFWGALSVFFLVCCSL
jgi:hypothetical protein